MWRPSALAGSGVSNSWSTIGAIIASKGRESIVRRSIATIIPPSAGEVYTRPHHRSLASDNKRDRRSCFGKSRLVSLSGMSTSRHAGFTGGTRGHATKVETEGDRWKEDYVDSLMHKAGQMNLRYTVIDSEGKPTTDVGIVKKADLCREHDLDPRDIRKLDSVQPNLVPTILSRNSSIIVNMLHVRALIKADSVILFDPAGSLPPGGRGAPDVGGGRPRGGNHLKERLLAHISYNLGGVRKYRLRQKQLAREREIEEEEKEIKASVAGGEMGGNRMEFLSRQMMDLRDRVEENEPGIVRESMREPFLGKEGVEGVEVDKLAYEHRALESILVSVANALEEEMKYTRKVVNELLADLENDINRENLKQLLHHSRRLAGFRGRVRYVLQSIEEVLESDEDLSAMYLTAKKEHQPRGLQDHQELEMLLESFSKQVEEIVSEVETTVSNMQSTQEIAELMLDANRNSLLGLDLKVSMATLGVGCGALTAGLFGMNLTSHWEQDPFAFYAVTGTSFTLSLLIFLYGLKHLRRVRRVGLRSPGQSNSAVWKPTLRNRVAETFWLRARNASPQPVKQKVWINEQADAARARDAVRAQLIEEKREERMRDAEGRGQDWGAMPVRFKASRMKD